MHADIRNPCAVTPLLNDAADKPPGTVEAHMNHSIYSADRTTHLKIVVVALVAGVYLAGVGLFSKNFSADYAQSARVIKADKPVMITNSGASVVR